MGTKTAQEFAGQEGPWWEGPQCEGQGAGKQLWLAGAEGAGVRAQGAGDGWGIRTGLERHNSLEFVVRATGHDRKF